MQPSPSSSSAGCSCSQSADTYRHLLSNDGFKYLRTAVESVSGYANSASCTKGDCLERYAHLIAEVVNLYRSLIYSGPGSHTSVRIGNFQTLLDFDLPTRRLLLRSDLESFKQTIERLLQLVQSNTFDDSTAAEPMLTWTHQEVERLLSWTIGLSIQFRITNGTEEHFDVSRLLHTSRDDISKKWKTIPLGTCWWWRLSSPADQIFHD